MLVLSRRIGEKIIMDTPEGRRVEIIFLGEVDNHQGFRLGFNAPKDVIFVREEILDKKEAKKTTQPTRPERRVARGGLNKSTV